MTTSSVSLGIKTTDGILHTGSTRLSAVQIITDGTNAATVILYDNTAASGNVVFKDSCVAGASGKAVVFNQPVACKNGLYLDIAGTGASCIVCTG